MIELWPATTSAPAKSLHPLTFFPFLTRNWGKFQFRRWRHGWGVPDPKEGLIEQSRHTRNGGRPTTPARRFGRAAIIVAALVLVALAWIGARDAIRAHRGEVARAQAEVAAAAVDRGVSQ
jgi:hypothetical protein